MEKKSLGRPSKYTTQIADVICHRLIGGESLRQICRDDGMPATGTVCRWLSDNERFREQYRYAREAQAEAIYDEMFDIADDARNDWMERETKNGGLVVVPNHEHISRSKLRINMRMWALARMAPKRYGDRIHQELTGKDGAALNSPTISNEQLAAALNALAIGLPVHKEPFDEVQEEGDVSDLV